MKRIALIVGLGFAAACGGGAKDPAEPTAAVAVLGLGEATLSAETDGKPSILSLDADGKVYADGTHLMTFTAAGDILDPSGTVQAKISAEGVVTRADGTASPDHIPQIRADGAIVDKGEVMIEFGADGYLTGPFIATEGGGAKIKFTGAPQTRRALALAWALASAPAKQDPPVTSPAPTPVTP